MPHYYAEECYTPDDPDNGDRRRRYAEFDTTDTDPIAVAARAMVALRPDAGLTLDEAVRRLKADNADDEIAEAELTSDDPEENTIEFVLFGNDGEYNITLSQSPSIVRRHAKYVYMCNGQPVAIREYQDDRVIAELAQRHKLPAASFSVVRVEDY